MAALLGVPPTIPLAASTTTKKEKGRAVERKRTPQASVRSPSGSASLTQLILADTSGWIKIDRGTRSN